MWCWLHEIQTEVWRSLDVNGQKSRPNAMHTQYPTTATHETSICSPRDGGGCHGMQHTPFLPVVHSAHDESMGVVA